MLAALRPSLSRPATYNFRAFSTAAAKANVAKLTLIGRLAAEPELTATSTGRDIIKYSVGTSTGPQENRQTSWWRITSFDEGKGRDILLSAAKGSLVHVEATGKMDTFEDRNGQQRSQLNLVQRSFNILVRPRNQDGDARYAEGGVESNAQSAAEEPQSGIGHS